MKDYLDWQKIEEWEDKKYAAKVLCVFWVVGTVVIFLIYMGWYMGLK